jgi:hypothetical protein
MELSKDDLMGVMNLLLNDLVYSMCLLDKLRVLEEQGDLSRDGSTELCSSLISLSILKVNKFDELIAKDSSLIPNKEGIRIIEFWRQATECIDADEADDD